MIESLEACRRRASCGRLAQRSGRRVVWYVVFLEKSRLNCFYKWREQLTTSPVTLQKHLMLARATALGLERCRTVAVWGNASLEELDVVEAVWVSYCAFSFGQAGNRGKLSRSWPSANHVLFVRWTCVTTLTI